MIRVRVYARVNPTEDKEKVLQSIKNIFPSLNYRVEEDRIIGEGEGEGVLSKFLQIIGREEIAPRTLSLLKSRRKGNRIVIPLDREVALVERLSFGEESELGPIWVEIEGDIDRILYLITNLIK